MNPTLPPGHPQPWKVVWRSIEYPGQIIVAPRWKPSFGKELPQGDIHFRTVILTQPQEVPPESIKDRRIALWVPQEPLPALPALESGTLREAGATYEVGERYYRETAFSRGRIVSPSPLPQDIAQKLATASLEEGLNALATALLEETYVGFPLDTSGWKYHLSAADIANLFEGLLRQRDDPPAVAAVERFAAGLALASPDDPFTLAPQHNPIFPAILDMLSQGGGRLSLPALYRQLSQRFGLTRPLITLYLLSLLHHNEPPLEVILRPRHRIVLRDGERPPQGRLTAAMASQVWWGRGLEEDFAELRFGTTSSWNMALPYARAVLQELKATEDQPAVNAQESSLVAALKELGVAAAQARGELTTLAETLGDKPASGSFEALERLVEMAKSHSYPEFYASSQRIYPSPEALAEDVSFCGHLRSFAPRAMEMARAKVYLTKALLDDGDAELELDRQSLLEQLTLANILANPQLWDSLSSLIHWFRSRYSVLYAAHHRRYWQEVSAWARVLADARIDLETIHRLNSIEELGEPLGQELTLEFQRILSRSRPCPLAEASEPLREWEPRCPHCDLSLTSELSQGELEDFLARLHQALVGQQRRLSSQAVRQILSRNTEGNLERFIKVIQTSDLSSLSQVMDDELVAFIRRLLAEAYTTVATEPLLRKIGEKFPRIKEHEVEVVAAELVRLLRGAFVEAKARHAGAPDPKGSG